MSKLDRKAVTYVMYLCSLFAEVYMATTLGSMVLFKRKKKAWLDYNCYQLYIDIYTKTYFGCGSR